MDWAIKTVMKNVPTTVQLILTDFTFNIYNLLKFSINCYKSSIFHMPTDWKHFIKRKHTHINTKLNRYKRARKSQSLISWKQNIIHEWFPYLLQFYSACWHPFFPCPCMISFFSSSRFSPFLSVTLTFLGIIGNFSSKMSDKSQNILWNNNRSASIVRLNNGWKVSMKFESNIFDSFHFVQV